MSVKESLQVSLGVSLAVFDAGIAAWDMKYCECSLVIPTSLLLIVLSCFSSICSLRLSPPGHGH